MPNQFIVKLNFTSPLHLARGRSDYSQSEKVLHSDALKSALFVVAQLLYDETKLGQYGESFFNGVHLSSAFPFWGKYLFFPRPMVDLMPYFDPKEDIEFKSAKKIEYIEQSLYLDFLHGRKGLWKNDMLAGGNCLMPNVFSNDTERKKFKIIEDNLYQHVVVPRYSVDEADADTFYMERLWFQPNAGLFFLVEFSDPDMQPIFEHALNLLADEGIGSDRSTGNGQFAAPKLENFSMEGPADASHTLNLSLFCPTETELTKSFMDKASYMLIKRGGYISSAETSEHTTLLKCPIYMFREGSLFEAPKLEGKLANLKPSAMSGHPVWREGRPLTLPVILG